MHQKLTGRQVQEIKQKHEEYQAACEKAGVKSLPGKSPYYSLAEKFGVHHTTVYDVARGVSFVKKEDKPMRSDLQIIKQMIEEFEKPHGTTSLLRDENAILRQLLTSWQSEFAREYQTDAKLHLNMLTKRMLNPPEPHVTDDKSSP